MAQKKITDLQLRDNVSGTLNFPSDDTVQSYRVTAEQIKNYVLANEAISRAMLAQGSLGRLVVTPVTSTHSVSTSEDLVLCSGAAFTVTLPTAVGVAGRRYVIKKTDSSFSNVITIATTSAQTIDGAPNTTLNSVNESVELVSDGANWQIVNRRIPSVWVSTTVSVAAASSGPTKGGIVRDELKYRRNGNALDIIVSYAQNNSGANAGNGIYLFTIPGSLSADHPYNTTITADETDAAGYIGNGLVLRNGAHQGTVHAFLYDATRFYLKFTGGLQDTTGTTFTADAGNAFAHGTVINFGHIFGINLNLKIPILGWNG